MVYYKKSEYGSQFKVSSLVKNLPIYEEHLTFRNQRKLHDRTHTPIVWDDDPVHSDSDDPVEELPLHKLKISEVEKNDGDKSDIQTADSKSVDSVAKSIENRGNDNCNNNDEADSEGPVCDVEIVKIDDNLRKSAIVKINDNLRKSAKAKLNTYASKDNTDEPTASTKSVTEKKKLGKTYTKPAAAEEKLFVKRPRKPYRQIKISEKPHGPLRPHSARTSTKSSDSISSKPFLNYGCGNDTAIGQKKTFNIRAQSAVDPAALRAKQRNQMMLAKIREKQCELDREKHRKLRIKQLLIQSSSVWDTEYRRSYPLYDDDTYSTVQTEPRRQKSSFTK